MASGHSHPGRCPPAARWDERRQPQGNPRSVAGRARESAIGLRSDPTPPARLKVPGARGRTKVAVRGGAPCARGSCARNPGAAGWAWRGPPVLGAANAAGRPRAGASPDPGSGPSGGHCVGTRPPGKKWSDERGRRMEGSATSALGNKA